MKIYLDQMLNVDLATRLRQEGHDVQRATEVGQARADDELILRHACLEQRTLITLDQHFGDWVILPLSQHCGVIRVRVHPATTHRIGKLLLPFLKRYAQETLRNYLVILSPNGERWVNTSKE